jgi:hypothetical protein
MVYREFTAYPGPLRTLTGPPEAQPDVCPAHLERCGFAVNLDLYKM